MRLTEEEIKLLKEIKANQVIAYAAQATPQRVSQIIRKGAGPLHTRKATTIILTARRLLALLEGTKNSDNPFINPLNNQKYE